jgi:nitrogen-specific signal transduction histidine kinase/CheY-like chemotaxis protein
MFEGRETPSEWVGTLTDIEDQKQTEEVIRQKQKLESVGLLAGGIAHDFNNLLVGIMGGASFALQSVQKTHPAYDMLETVSRASERAAHLVRQLLAYTGKGAAPVECVNLSELVKDTSDLVRATIPRSVQVIVDVDPRLPKVETNEAQMQQLLINLIVNAAEAIGDAPGIVRVRVTLREIDASWVERNVLGYRISPGQYAEIEVTDTGCGMDSETQARIFDPFFTTKFTGRGLGLSAVQGIVRSAHGSLQVTSAPGAGTTFRILLPVTKANAFAAPGSITEARAPESARILVIDDEQLVRDVVTKALPPHGYTVLAAEDGQQGIHIFKREAAALSLVLLDQSMPGMSGTQVLEKLKEIAPDVPVVIASGYSETEMARQFHGLPAVGFLEKPFTSAALVQKIGKFIAEHRRKR